MRLDYHNLGRLSYQRGRNPHYAFTWLNDTPVAELIARRDRKTISTDYCFQAKTKSIVE